MNLIRVNNILINLTLVHYFELIESDKGPKLYIHFSADEKDYPLDFIGEIATTLFTWLTKRYGQLAIREETVERNTTN